MTSAYFFLQTPSTDRLCPWTDIDYSAQFTLFQLTLLQFTLFQLAEVQLTEPQFTLSHVRGSPSDHSNWLAITPVLALAVVVPWTAA